MPKLIAVDMDGTFLNAAGDYDRERFARLYPRLEAAGIQFVVASGNQYWQLRTFFTDYPDVLYAAENGALVGSASEIWETWPLSMAATWSAVELLDRIPNLVTLLCGMESAYTLSHNPPDIVERLRTYYTRLDLRDSWDGLPEGALNLVLACPPDQTDHLMQRFQTDLPEGIVAVSSRDGVIDLIPAEVSKATALTWIGNRLGITAADIVAFGDGQNDIEMLKLAGTGVAMGNALPAAKAAADVLTLGNDESGVLDYLERMLVSRP
ncbi:MAG: Cof-type HAD-IIB family hydrolase [Propioniciclava sp.]